MIFPLGPDGTGRRVATNIADLSVPVNAQALSNVDMSIHVVNGGFSLTSPSKSKCVLKTPGDNPEIWEASTHRPFEVPYVHLNGSWCTSTPGLFRIVESIQQFSFCDFR